MKTESIASAASFHADPSIASDADRLASMRELLTDLRTSIQTQRHMITISRELIDRS